VKNESASPAASTAGANKAPGLPAAVDRAAFQAELDRLREREKAHTREGDAMPRPGDACPWSRSTPASR
jgi:Bacterial protein of unknown function (DUF899)